MRNKIRHFGTIETIADGSISVRIVQASACAACKVAGYCSAAESKEKLVEVKCADVSPYRVGQQVVVAVSRGVAGQALLLAFGAPFVLLLTVLVVVLQVSGNEGLAALSALAALVPYYLLLWLLRKRLGQRISFLIEE